MTAKEFNLCERIIGAAKHSIILRGDNGEHIFCSNKLFNKLIINPNLEIRITTLSEHWENTPKGKIWHEQTKWIEAFVPVRF